MLPFAKVPLMNGSSFPQLVAAVVAVLAGASDASLAKVRLINGICFHREAAEVVAVL